MHNLTPEEKAIGRENFQSAVGSEFTRRDFLKGALAATAVTAGGVGAMYYGYESQIGNPVRVAVIGTGDEGGVLIGAHTPDFVNIIAISDIRPYNIHRAFFGDETNDNTKRVRPGLLKKYGWSTRDEGEKHIKVKTDYHEVLDDPDVEAVIIALPLHLHAPVAVEAMRKGKHVLTEKLMGHSVHQCKEMARISFDAGRLLATGHQRHYSILYDNSVNLIQRGLLGDIHHIRAQWHRGNLPGHDSWQPPMPDQLEAQLKQVDADLAALSKEMEEMKFKIGKEFNDQLLSQQAVLMTRKKLLEAQALDKTVDAAKYGYQPVSLPSGTRPPLEELIRWRLWRRTGGGLMAELGSHQLDASGIFVSASRTDGQKVHPLSVSATGGRYIFPADRECEDQVFATYEFPGPEYDKDPNKKIVVTYSSINGNGFGGYGEVVMGTKGTLILEREEEVMLFKEANTSTKIRVSKAKAGGGAVLDTTQSGGGEATAGKKILELGPPSRGYTEEIEHWAWCIRKFNEADFKKDPEKYDPQPKCRPKIAMADAIIAHTTNLAIAGGKRIDFKPEWYDIASDETPEGVAPDVKRPEYQPKS